MIKYWEYETCVCWLCKNKPSQCWIYFILAVKTFVIFIHYRVIIFFNQKYDHGKYA